MKRSLPPPLLPRLSSLAGTRGPLCSELWWGEPPWPGHVPSIPCSLLETPPRLPHPVIHGRTPLSALRSLCLFQPHQHRLSLSPVTSTPLVSPTPAPPELGQPSWVLQGGQGLLQDWFSSHGTVLCCSRACPSAATAVGWPWSRSRGTPAHGQE